MSSAVGRTSARLVSVGFTRVRNLPAGSQRAKLNPAVSTGEIPGLQHGLLTADRLRNGKQLIGNVYPIGRYSHDDALQLSLGSIVNAHYGVVTARLRQLEHMLTGCKKDILHLKRTIDRHHRLFV